MQNAHPTPFFIVGSPRSGTTLLRFMLSSHSRIHVPDETGFIPFLRAPFDKPLDRRQVRRVLQRIGHLNRFWDGMVSDVSSFYDTLTEPRLTYVLDRLYRIRMAEHGAARWGDKTPLYVQYIPHLHRLFPAAQFIHVIRDGRDATLSALQKWSRGKPYLDHYYLLKNWGRHVNAGRSAGRDLGTALYLEIRYENLVSRPEEVLRAVCTFLNERFEAEMLTPARAATVAGAGIDGHVEPQFPISDSHVARWVTEMSSFEKKLADYLAGPTLESLGYPLAGLDPFSVTERIRLAYLSAKYGIADNVRTMLYRLGILTLNRNRRQPLLA